MPPFCAVLAPGCKSPRLAGNWPRTALVKVRRKRSRVPGRRHHVDVADAELQLRQCSLEREMRELEGMLVPAEPLLLQHECGDAVLQ